MARPELSCCVPHLDSAFPSGPKWTHNRNCTVVLNRGQRVDLRDIAPELDARLRHPSVDERLVGIVSALRSHPHGCICFGCLYIDHHLDDEDDEREVFV